MIEGGIVYERAAIRLLQPAVHQGKMPPSWENDYTMVPCTIQIPAGILIASGNAGSESVRGLFFEAQQPLQFKFMDEKIVVKGGIFLPENEKVAPDIYWYATDSDVPLFDSDSTIRFERTTYEDWKSDSFRRELVYNGRSGTTIKLLYREFTEERIRPAFTQEVTYDLSQGETIGFKGTRFQVLDADNIRIKYVVLQHFE